MIIIRCCCGIAFINMDLWLLFAVPLLYAVFLRMIAGRGQLEIVIYSEACGDRCSQMVRIYHRHHHTILLLSLWLSLRALGFARAIYSTQSTFAKLTEGEYPESLS